MKIETNQRIEQEKKNHQDQVNKLKKDNATLEKKLKAKPEDAPFTVNMKP